MLVDSTRPDVVLMDLHLGPGSGIEATRALSRDHPEVRVLVVTMLNDDASLVAAVRAGARGYVLKGPRPRTWSAASGVWPAATWSSAARSPTAPPLCWAPAPTARSRN
ncbi:response regulator transcription factor [Micromonospora sp. BRA006-A]|nr:response regulator transcription factor [Micromonospora sp. BRA006-A]